MIYLASQSPRRKALLRQISVAFRSLNIQISEDPQEREDPQEYVRRMALEKARAGQMLLAGDEKKLPVLGADTIVMLEGDILGKPNNEEQGLKMLARLSGRTHKVLSAVAIVTPIFTEVELSISEVTFRDITEEEREIYWKTGEPIDKAGAYAIQGMGAIFIKHLFGSYSGVMGLPLYETAKLLARV